MSWRDNDYYRYYMQQPPITRTFLLGVVLISVPPLLYLVSPIWYLNFWDYTIRGEIWRPFTAFLYGGGGISLLFGLFFAYQYSMQLETGKFGDSTADYAFYLLFSMINLMVSSFSTRHRNEYCCGVVWASVYTQKRALISGWCLHYSNFQPW